MAPTLPPKIAPGPFSPARPDSQKIGGRVVSTDMLDTLRQASRKTGVDFSYLVSQAAQESGFKPDAQAKTSSARGLFQFIDRTWLGLVKEHGAKYGLGEEAGKITLGNDGRPQVNDSASRQAILALRDEPSLAAAMAGEYARSNQAILSREFGVDLKKVDLYLGHFLGANGATKFLAGLRDQPNQSGADLLPEAAAANRGVFYTADGETKSLREIYSSLSRKLDANAEGLNEADDAPAKGAPTPLDLERQQQREMVNRSVKMMAYEALHKMMLRTIRLTSSDTDPQT